MLRFKKSNVQGHAPVDWTEAPDGTWKSVHLVVLATAFC